MRIRQHRAVRLAILAVYSAAELALSQQRGMACLVTRTRRVLLLDLEDDDDDDDDESEGDDGGDGDGADSGQDVAMDED